MKNFKGALFSSSVVFLLLSLAVLVFSFRNLGKWLMVSDPLPGHLDIVFTFAGENVRVAYSKELMSRFSDAHWMLSDYKDGHSRLLKRSNYDMSKVSVIDSCRNTYSEVDALMKRLSSQKEELHVGLVSGPYHMRRIKIMLSRYPETKNYHFYFLPVPLERYNWTDNMIKKWWRSGTVSSAVISEVQKIVYFFLVT